MCILGAGSTAVVLFSPVAPDTEYTVDQLKGLFFTPIYFGFFCCSTAAAATILVWIYCSRDRMAIEIDGVEHMTVDWKDTSREGASMLSTAEDSALAKAPSRPGSESAASSRREGLLYAVASAVTGSITITLSKITMLLVRTTIEGAEGSSDGADSNQLLAPSAWCFILGLACR